MATGTDTSFPDHLYERVQLNSKLGVGDSVNRLLEVPEGRMNYLDLIYKCPDIIHLSCKLRNQQGLQDAQAILDRMLAEKRISGRIIPAKPFEILIFGWTKVADQVPQEAMQKHDATGVSHGTRGFVRSATCPRQQQQGRRPVDIMSTNDAHFQYSFAGNGRDGETNTADSPRSRSLAKDNERSTLDKGMAHKAQHEELHTRYHGIWQHGQI